ncbi:MAG: OmpA family protein [Gammaproteobacteria bacterium]|nr:OmpA family protein [Gammaproteobacteria bacterium]MDP2141727.1 OmpA family protein [Gammaproteobacteria bacterium]MDP2347962.1 OmpA family protein [Gammaproteobacteria bacterium]
MKIQMTETHAGSFKKLFTVGAAILVLTACASAPTAPDGAAAVRTKLTMLRTNAELASRAPIEIQAAELAVVAAEQPERDRVVARHLVLIADQKVDIAGAWAQSRLYEDQRAELSARSEAVRLDARTREADRARNDAANARTQASVARSDADAARSDTDFARQQAAIARNAASSAQSDANVARDQAASSRTAADVARDQAAMARNDANAARSATAVAQGQTSAARSDANAARNDADIARAEAADLQRQINELNAMVTERGLVVTLGDVLFETGNSELRGGTPNNLDKLAAFLNEFPDRTVVIEGHTDSVGDDTSNQNLSQRRADSVKNYLIMQRVVGSRMTAFGLGEGSPIADNASPTGRQQNRRVEVIISNQ